MDTLKCDLGNVRIPEFPSRFEMYVRHLKTTESNRGALRSAAAINRPIEIVKACFKLCVALELLSKNPITKQKFPLLDETPRDVVISESERSKLQEVVDKQAPHLSAIIKFAMQVPCRKSELVNMRREDLDLDKSAIRVKNGTTKNEEGVWKPIPPNMLDYFQSIPPESEFLFYRVVKGTGNACPPTYLPLGDFKNAWRSCREKAGLLRLHFHDTRHISATRLVNNGTPEQVVNTVAGWKTNMLRDYYHREPIAALDLVQFGPRRGRDSVVIASKTKRHKKCQK